MPCAACDAPQDARAGWTAVGGRAICPTCAPHLAEIRATLGRVSAEKPYLIPDPDSHAIAFARHWIRRTRISD